MKKHAIAALMPLAITLALAPATAEACGPVDVCGDITASFAGTVISEGLAPGEDRVRLEWQTDSESHLVGYRVQRYRCAVAEHCSTNTHLVYAAGSCGTTETYAVEDQPEGAAREWTYRLEVWRSDGSLACAAEVDIF